MNIKKLIQIVFVLTVAVFGDEYSDGSWVLEKNSKIGFIDKKAIKKLLKYANNDSAVASNMFFNIAMDLLDKNNKRNSIVNLNRCWLLNKRNPNCYFGFAAVYSKFNDLDRKHFYLCRTIEVDSNYSPAYLSYAKSHLFYYKNEKGHCEEKTDHRGIALKYINKALALYEYKEKAECYMFYYYYSNEEDSLACEIGRNCRLEDIKKEIKNIIICE